MHLPFSRSYYMDDINKHNSEKKKKGKRVARFLYQNPNEQNIAVKTDKDNISCQDDERYFEKIPIFFNIVSRGSFPSITFQNGSVFIE